MPKHPQQTIPCSIELNKHFLKVKIKLLLCFKTREYQLEKTCIWPKQSSIRFLVISSRSGSFFNRAFCSLRSNTLENESRAEHQASSPRLRTASRGQPAQVDARALKVNVAKATSPQRQYQCQSDYRRVCGFRCPFCEQFFTNTESQLIKDYVDTGKVQFSIRQYAFLGSASTVARTRERRMRLMTTGKFWDFHDYLYKNQPAETDTSMV